MTGIEKDIDNMRREQNTKEIQAEYSTKNQMEINSEANQIKKDRAILIEEALINRILHILADVLENCRASQSSTKPCEKIGGIFRIFRGVITNSLIFLFVLLIAYVGYQELRREYVIIDEFEVPKILEDHGYTGRVIANKLVDQIKTIETKAKSKMKHKMFMPVWQETEIEIEIPGRGISLSSALQYIKRFIGRDLTRINGEIISQETQLNVTIRVNGKPSESINGTITDLNKIMLHTAKLSLKYTQPYILAAYLSDFDQKASIEIVNYVLSHEPAKDDPWAYNLWGNILGEQNDFEGAIEKYQKAIEFDHKFASAYNGWGVVLIKQKDYKQAIEMLKKATKYAHNYAAAYNNMGFALMKQKDYMAADSIFQKAIELEPNYTNAYFNWGILLMHMGDHKGAVGKLQKVIELDYNGSAGDKAKKILNKLNVKTK